MGESNYSFQLRQYHSSPFSFRTSLLVGGLPDPPSYSLKALNRVWKTERFSWYLTNLTHRFNDDPFEQRMKEAELAYITSSDAGRQTMAENYVGLPL